MPTATVRALCSSVLLALLGQGAFAQGQKGAPPLRLTFRALTDDGQQISDLKINELALKINGKPRPLLSLSMSQTAPGGANEERAGLPIPYSTNTVGTSGR